MSKVQAITYEQYSFDLVEPKRWFAVLISNPEIRSTGNSEQEALENLKQTIFMKLGFSRKIPEDAKIHDISFDDIEIQTVMNS